MFLIRIDDYPTGVRPILPDHIARLGAVLKAFEEKGVPYLLGVVPELLEQADHEYLRTLKHATIALHGCDHLYGRWKEGDPDNEFLGLPYAEVERKVTEGLAKLAEWAPRIYIPPFNTVTNELLDVLHEKGVEVVCTSDYTGYERFPSAGKLREVKTPTPLYGRTPGLVQLLKENRQALSSGDFCVSLHVTWEDDEVMAGTSALQEFLDLVGPSAMSWERVLKPKTTSQPAPAKAPAKPKKTSSKSGPIKILHITEQLSKGGAGRALIANAKYSARQGDFQHKAISIAPISDGVDTEGLEVLQAPSLERVRMEIEQADIVQWHWWEDIPLMRQSLPKHYALLVCHTSGNRAPHQLTPFEIDFANHIVAVCEHSLTLPGFKAIDPEKLSQIYVGADFERILPVEKIPHNGFTTGWIGTIDDNRYPPDFLQVHDGIDIPDFKVLMVGMGPMWLDIHDQIVDLGLTDEFKMLGYREDMRKVYGSLDVYGMLLNPNTTAAAELNLQEAMASGLPVVMLPIGGPQCMIENGVSGIIAADAREYQQAMEHLYHHPEERERLGNNARELALRRFGAENAARRFNKLYTKICAGKVPAPGCFGKPLSRNEPPPAPVFRDLSGAKRNGNPETEAAIGAQPSARVIPSDPEHLSKDEESAFKAVAESPAVDVSAFQCRNAARNPKSKNQRPKSPGYRVSAIVSTYNSEKFIRGCLDDLIAQTLYQKGELEIVVVNTGSQQNEREIVEQYKQRYDHITHIYIPEREGMYAAWNRGIKAASGKYITSSNTDDRHRVDALERMANVLDSRPDVALVYADVDVTTQENATFGTGPVKGKYQWLEFDRRTMFMACYMGPQPMWRGSLHDLYGYFEPDFKSAGDYEFWLRICPTETFLHIPETLGLYLESPTSVEHANQEAAARETLTALQRHWPKEWGPQPEPGTQNALAASQAKVEAQPAVSSAGDLISQAISIAARGDNKSARALLWKAIESDPNQAPAYHNLATLLVKDGHVIDAADHACKAVELDPSDASAIEVLTKVKTLLRATKPAPKAKSGRKAAKRGPTQADIDARLKRINSLLSAAAPTATKPASRTTKPTLSVCMIVRDEEAFIEDCLVSVRGFADEIIIVDTGSRDRTVDIARSQGALVHSFKWNGSFADARNHALEHATCDWVLCLDADERLDANSKPIIEQAMADTDVDCYDLTLCSYLTDGPTAEVEISTRCGLFRNRADYRFEGRIHEQVAPSIIASGGRAARTQAVIYHHGYRPDVKNNRQKHKKYVELLRKEIEANPSDAYYLYHLGTELAAHGERAEAIPSLAKAADLLPRGHNLAPLTFARLAESLMVAGDLTQAMAAIERAESTGISHPQLSFARGNILRRLERWDEAAEAFEIAITLGKKGLWDGDPSVYGHKAQYGLASSYMALGHYDAAAEQAHMALQARPDNRDAAHLLTKAKELAKSPAAKPSTPVRKTAPKPKAQPKISLCMIARDEEAFIAQCLESARDFVDEIIVVDTGSTDRTPEIARSYTAKVYEFEWNDNYSDARNEALRHASHEWIFVLDADEKLDPATVHLLRAEIANPHADAYTIPFRNYMTDGVTPDVTNHRVCRLFRNRPDYRYESRVHEHVENSITRNGGSIGQLDVLVHHYGYRTDIVAERGKHEKYVGMLEAEVEDNPDDVFYLHHLSSALCAGNEFDRAIPHLRHACDIVESNSAFAAMVFSHLVNALREMGRFDEALDVVERAGKIGIKYPQLSFCHANVLLALNRPAEAIEAFEAAIAMGRGKTWTGDSGTVGYKADFGLASAYFQMGDHARAIEYAQSTLAQKPGNIAALELLSKVYESMGNQPMREKYLSELSAQLPGDPKPIVSLAEMYEQQGRSAEAAGRFESLIGIGQETATLRVKLGNLAEARGSHDEAERHYLRAIEIDPSAPEVYNSLGQLRLAQGRRQEALDLFTTAIEVAPDSADAYFNAGDVLYAGGGYTQAADFYQAGLERNPSHAPAFLRLGNCYVHTEVPQAAAIAYRQALAIDPNFADASNNLAMAEEMLAPKAA